jgi:hypothetical protein
MLHQQAALAAVVMDTQVRLILGLLEQAAKVIPEGTELTQPDMQVVVVAVQAALVKMQALLLQVILLERGALESPPQLQGHLLATQVVAGVERVQH